MTSWLGAAFKLTVDLAYVTMLLWLALSILRSTGIAEIYVIFLEATP